MSTDIDYIKVDNYQKSKKKKSRKKSKAARTLIAILLFLLLAATVVFFIIAGNKDTIDITDGADSAFVPVTEASGEPGGASPAPTPTPIPTPTPTPIPTPAPTPMNNNPATGTVLLRKFSDEACTVSIKNNLDKDCCVVITHVKSETDAVVVFVRAGEECEVKTPNGTYRLTAKAGDVYLSTDSYFGSDTETIELAEVPLPWGETYSVSVNG
ncbi:MAG: hypothetical protein Q4F31_10360 [Eubacteriales bacterium]|nr:hypothetical protein [Eubacteriales bacterium]